MSTHLGPFYNLKQAAEYCGMAGRTFQRYLRDFELPRSGPKRNKFSSSVLDLWMENPEQFRKQVKPQPRRRGPIQLQV